MSLEVTYKDKQEFTIGNYVCQTKIGKGTFANIYLGEAMYENVTPKYIAVKKIYLSRMGKYKHKLFSEIQIMKQMNHDNILKIYDYLIQDKFAYLLLEYCDFGDLSHLWQNEMEKHQGLEKEVIFNMMRQIFYGFKYLKETDQNLIHRDIKLENILLKNENDKLIVKIADFGFCLLGKTYNQRLKETNANMTICGSPLYMAPELWKTNENKTYDDKIDIWSLGIILFKMKFGYYSHPFGKVKTIEDMFRAHQAVNDSTVYRINDILLRSTCTCSFYIICYECSIMNLMSRMLQSDVVKRINWREIFEHPFMNIELKNTQYTLTKSYNVKLDVNREGSEYKINFLKKYKVIDDYEGHYSAILDNHYQFHKLDTKICTIFDIIYFRR